MNETADEPKKQRGGRRPMTAEEKDAAAKLRAAEKAKADNLMNRSAFCHGNRL